MPRARISFSIFPPFLCRSALTRVFPFRLLATRVGSTCLLLLDALKQQPPAAQRAAREQAQVCNDFLNALVLNHTISADVAGAGAAKFSELFK